jgi:hypothetical protein
MQPLEIADPYSLVSGITAFSVYFYIYFSLFSMAMIKYLRVHVLDSIILRYIHTGLICITRDLQTSNLFASTDSNSTSGDLSHLSTKCPFLNCNHYLRDFEVEDASSGSKIRVLCNNHIDLYGFPSFLMPIDLLIESLTYDLSRFFIFLLTYLRPLVLMSTPYPAHDNREVFLSLAKPWPKNLNRSCLVVMQVYMPSLIVGVVAFSYNSVRLATCKNLDHYYRYICGSALWCLLTINCGLFVDRCNFLTNSPFALLYNHSLLNSISECFTLSGRLLMCIIATTIIRGQPSVGILFVRVEHLSDLLLVHNCAGHVYSNYGIYGINLLSSISHLTPKLASSALVRFHSIEENNIVFCTQGYYTTQYRNYSDWSFIIMFEVYCVCSLYVSSSLLSTLEK